MFELLCLRLCHDLISPVAGTAGGSEVNALVSILSVQEVGDYSAGDRQARQHGENLLNRLDELRLGLLSGTIALDRLDKILELVQRQHEATVDPKLREVLREIEVRALVELVKLSLLG